MTIRQDVEKRLKENWYSNYQINIAVKSSSGDRELRNLRKLPPDGYVMQQRPKKKVEGYRSCLEYKLVKEEEIDERVVK